MKITSNLGSHPRVIARSRMVANHSRAIARPGTAAAAGSAPTTRAPSPSRLCHCGVPPACSR